MAHFTGDLEEHLLLLLRMLSAEIHDSKKHATLSRGNLEDLPAHLHT